MSRSRTSEGLRILTIGYEGSSLECFLQTLKAAGVSLLLDVRELPLSRRKGFSKTQLSQALAEAGIDYQHERAFGAPRHIRHRLRADGDLARYFADFREYLVTQRATLDLLARTAHGVVALLCYERNPAECHRSVVAAALARRTGTTVEHLGVPLHGTQQTSHATHPHPRQSLSAAK
jgi:uncharacterized protein (DUF488 family)